MPEQLIWLAFQCLALGAHALEYGHEDMDLPKWNKELVHFDLKPGNIKPINHLKRNGKFLLTSLSYLLAAMKRIDHARMPIMKVCLPNSVPLLRTPTDKSQVADFGMALNMARPENQAKDCSGRGTPSFYAPVSPPLPYSQSSHAQQEQKLRPAALTSKANIFQMGKIISMLINRSRRFNTNKAEIFMTCISDPRHNR